MAGRDPIIRASEIGEYEFCARAWWLHHVEGWETRFPERLQRGEVAHTRHGRRVETSRRLLWIGIACLVIAALIVLGQ